MEPYRIEEYRGYQIRIEYDEDGCYTANPRDWDNVCTINCYHRRYSIGDNQCKGDPWDDLRSIIIENISYQELIKLINKHAENIKITHNNKKWKLYQYDGYSKQFELYDEYDLSCVSTLCDNALEAMSDKYLFSIIQNSSTVAISNIYMYDHSGITISLGRFSCPWDSGCVGFIYVTKKKVLKEFGSIGVDKKNWEQKAYEQFKNEVKVYDAYLRGEIFSWGVHERINADETDEEPEYDDMAIDSCCGYVGTDEIDFMISEAKESIDHIIKCAEIEAAKAAEELARKRGVVASELSSIPVGTTFIFGNSAYQIDRHNLFNEVQVSMCAIVKNKVCHIWNPVTIESLEEGMINVLYQTIEQLKAA